MTQLPSRNALTWWLALAVLVYLTFKILFPFWEAIVWSLILSAVTWPIYKPLKRGLRLPDTAAAIVMSLLVLTALAVPMALILSSLVREVAPAYNAAVKFLADAPPPPAWLESVPMAADFWRESFAALHSGSGAGRQWIAPLLRPGARLLAFFGDTAAQGALSLFTLFFIYRNGERYASQTRAVLHHLFGDTLERLLKPTREALRSVFAGVILAAGAQGLVAGIGYAIAGIDAPILLGVATAVLAIVPFGAVLIWGGSAIALLSTGALWQAAFLVAWGLLLVSTVDNLVRPLVISGTSRLPYLQTFFAIIGGLAVFGLIGLFLGPAILAVWMVLWNEWVQSGNENNDLQTSRSEANAPIH